MLQMHHTIGRPEPNPGKLAMPAETVEIRRYPNRRFYDRSHSRYVTLEDIEEMVVGGQTIVIEDSKTGEDLTRQVLTQILLEGHPDKIALIPVAMLHSILRANDTVLEFWREYLRRSLAALESVQRGAIPFASPTDWMPSILPSMWPPARAGGESPDAVARRLAELEERLGRLEPRGDFHPPTAPRSVHPTDGPENRFGDMESSPRSARPAQPEQEKVAAPTSSTAVPQLQSRGPLRFLSTGTKSGKLPTASFAPTPSLSFEFSLPGPGMAGTAIA